jgi:hypothetical protein
MVYAPRTKIQYTTPGNGKKNLTNARKFLDPPMGLRAKI